MIMTTDSFNKNSPVRLLVLADDLTGALDTGTAVAAGSLRHPEGRRFDVIVSCDPDWPFEDASDQPDVLVIDTETRHLTAEETRSVIFPVVRRAAAAGIPHIYIKTDSAMRGNIGASFQAALDASGSPVLSFIPAFPQMDRTVRGGKVYIGGELLTDSFYAEDPLNRPVGADAGEVNADKEAVAKAVVAAANVPEDVALVLMGHGTSHTAKVTYSQMQAQMEALGYKNVFIGTVEGEPEETACEAVIEAVKAAGFTKVVLRPLMVVAGDHANNDMADPEDEESWLSMFTASGAFEQIDCQIEGLGRIPEVQALYVAHTADAIEAIG